MHSVYTIRACKQSVVHAPGCNSTSSSMQRQASTGPAGAQDHIRAYQAGKLELVPGCNLEQSLESTVMGALNRIRNEASEARAAAC